ncbi:bifunctional polysaccharide deacetylase/glycosyltransferase family 2 protein [Streptomyces lonegramiae]|uniref:Bifunctional polysaccharide deacetylase/glycosyltransferase family 2 protein n=1 Tax=Streptomyces lonegramiae TaxID=3075524 RepID=A0ABU2XM86_9ACTN|nr:bifunctional polysaccharide deacetylase/glycosyltransferase family 2 protein [Streptomyces sp. DSM 41529]MDT0547027.1 bifunctional polysaccharide deacetylase/glycosyltransferase family 2 protein [Streptomyces sp. DSM 41529]
MAAAGRHAVPRLRLVLGVATLVAVVCGILLDGYLHAEVGNDARVHRTLRADHVPDRVRTGGPVLAFDDRGRPTGHRIPARTIALTFDDGPDPRWTPEILKVLRDHDVPGTFFVLGQMVVRHPGLVRRVRAAGHEIGVHTFTHSDLAYQDRGRVDRELAQSQVALAGAAGITSSLFRAPYASTLGALDDLLWPVQRYLGDRGYISAFIDVDSQDWKRPPVERIIRNATPKAGKGAAVLFHDAGGDRSRTVRALGTYIERMQAKGYTFTTVTGALGAGTAVHPADGSRVWQGRALIWAAALTHFAMPGLAWLLAVVGLAVIARLLMMLVLAWWHRRARDRRRFTWGRTVEERVSVIVPAYNEKECIANTVNSLAASTHPIEILVVDDGSTDGTGDIVTALGLPNVRVLRQENAGKAAALNHGIAEARYDLIVMMDGDTVFEPGTVHELVRPFADPGVGAVAGNAKVGNRAGLIGAWQHIEYVMGFNLDRRMYDLLRCMPTIPGAIGAFRRRAVLEAGGMSADTLAEDTDITIALHRAGWRVVYQDSAHAWTEAPSTVAQLWRQRYRWSYGTMQALWKHRRSLVDHGPSGRFGRVGMPLVVLFQVVAPLCAPLIDLFTLYGVVFLDPVKSLLAWWALVLLQLLAAAYAFRLDRERYGPLLALPLQQIAYRQLMYLVLLHSCVTAASGALLPWQKLRRTGEVDPPRTPTPEPVR